LDRDIDGTRPVLLCSAKLDQLFTSAFAGALARAASPPSHLIADADIEEADYLLLPALA
jgi:hypothetical protein